MTTKVFAIELPTIHVETRVDEVMKFEFDLNEAPAEFVTYLLRQGLAIIVQRATSGMGDKTNREKREAIEKRVAALRKFEVGSVGGGTRAARVDIKEECVRTVLRDLLVKSGVKKSEAEKLARELDKRMASFRDLVVKPALMSVAPEKLPELDVIAARNWMSKVVDPAEVMAAEVARRQAAMALEI